MIGFTPSLLLLFSVALDARVSLAQQIPANLSAVLYPPYIYTPSVDGNYKPNHHGIQISHPNRTINPLLPRPHPVPPNPPPALPSLGPPPHPQSYWYEEIVHNGISPFIANGSSWKVFRNVKDYGAKGDGITDDAPAIQAAIDDGGRGVAGNDLGTTGGPAVVYFPQGTYLMAEGIQSFVDTMLIGNPIDRPTLKASAHLKNTTLLAMQDPAFGSTVNFYITVKNLVLDSTAYPAAQALTLIDWSVSQATQLTNVRFNMPPASQHTGVATPGGGSGTYLGNLDFVGGAIGINMNNQQYNLKDCTFTGTTTGVQISHGFALVFQGFTFTNCDVGINATAGDVGNVGSFALIDSSARSVRTVVLTKSQNVTSNSTTGDDSVVIQNLRTSGVDSTVVAGGITILKGDVPETWVYGNAYLPKGPPAGVHDAGTVYQSPRTPLLLSSGKYFTMAPPTYQEYKVQQVVNIKTVKDFPVFGDGQSVRSSPLCFELMPIC
jgi:glucan 1,3-beta-glucosidase